MLSGHSAPAVVVIGVCLSCAACASSRSSTGTEGGSNAQGGMNAAGAGTGRGSGGGRTGDGGSDDVGHGGTGPADGKTAGASGDKGSSGAPDTGVVRPCEGLAVTAKGSAGLIDDFEDGDLLIPNDDGRHGTWGYGYSVEDTCPQESPLLVAHPVSGRSVDDASRFAMRVQEAGCAVLSQDVAFNVANRAFCPYDVTAYDGVYFRAVGAGVELTVKLGLTSTEPRSFGGDGTCDQDGTITHCWDSYQVRFTLSDEWALYSFKWGDLSQAGYGTATDFDPALVTQILFEGTSQAPVPMVDFSTDDIGFFQGEPPASPP